MTEIIKQDYFKKQEFKNNIALEKTKTQNQLSNIQEINEEQFDNNVSSSILDPNSINEKEEKFTDGLIVKSHVQEESFSKSSSNNKNNKNIIDYVFKEEDTLWSIAKQFWGHGYFYPVILKLNPDLYIYDVNKGNIIKLLKDKDRALELINKITFYKKAKRYMYYTVRENDSWNIISSKLYGKKNRSALLKKINKGKLINGEKIIVPLMY